jgi:hypothetical protein
MLIVKTTRRSAGPGGLGMEELIERLVARTGIDRTTAKKAVGIIMAFLLKEGPSEQVRALVVRLPGGESMLAADDTDAGGFGIGGIMGVGTKLMAAGLSMGQVQAVTKEIIAYSREKAGEDVVGEIVGSIPGLGQFV